MTEHVLVKPSEPFDFSDWHWGDDVDDAFAELKDLMVTEITKVFTEAIPDCIMVWFRQEIRDTTTEPTLEVTFSVGQFDEINRRRSIPARRVVDGPVPRITYVFMVLARTKPIRAG